MAEDKKNSLINYYSALEIENQLLAEGKKRLENKLAEEKEICQKVEKVIMLSSTQLCAPCDKIDNLKAQRKNKRKEMEEQKQLIHSLQTSEVITQAMDDKVFKSIMASEKWLDVQDEVAIRSVKMIKAKVWAEYPKLDLKFLVMDYNEFNAEPLRTKATDIPAEENPNIDQAAQDAIDDPSPPLGDQIKDSNPPTTQAGLDFSTQ